MKKISAILLALIMMLSIAASAAMQGDLTGGSITIDDAISGQDYEAYQILYIESYNADTNSYSYKANDAWATWLAGKTSYVSIDAQGYVTWVKDANVVDFVKAAQEHAETLTADASATADGETVTLSGLNLGWYLVDTTLGTLCSIDTTAPNVTMKEKNAAPTIIKEVQEDNGAAWGEKNDADFNQVVNFRSTITVGTGAENYVMHDTMSAGLTYGGVSSVTVDGAAVDAANYTVKTSNTCGCTFEVEFTDEYIATLATDKQIVVTYWATLNENAVVGLSGNTNEVKLAYGEETDLSYTNTDSTITYTWDAGFEKYAVKEGVEINLANAIFKLSSDKDGLNTYKFHTTNTANTYNVCVDANCEAEHQETITTDATGKFHIDGLDAGTYYLTETEAPAGYNKLAAPVVIEITGKETVDGTDTYVTEETKVLNQTGSELPSTGGIGTTIFYTVGGLMMAAAIVLLVAKKKVAASK